MDATRIFLGAPTCKVWEPLNKHEHFRIVDVDITTVAIDFLTLTHFGRVIVERVHAITEESFL